MGGVVFCACFSHKDSFEKFRVDLISRTINFKNIRADDISWKRPKSTKINLREN